MKFPQVANNAWLQSFGLGLWLITAVVFVCAPFLFLSGVGNSAGEISQRIQNAVQAQLAPKIEQRNIPKPVVDTVTTLLNQPQLGLNYLTVRNADRVIMLSDGDLQDALDWLPAQQAREWRGFFYRISSFDRSSALRVEGEIVAYIDYGIASGRVLVELSAWSWLVLLLTLAAGITLLWLFPIASSAIQARFSKSKDAEPALKPQPKRARANFQIADNANELQLCDQMGMGYVAVDGQGTIVDVNVNAARLMGFELRRLAGQPLERLLVLEDADSARVEAPVTACLQGKQKPLQRRAWLRRRDGKLLGVEMHAAQISASARVAAGMLFWEAGEAMNSQRQDAERAILAQHLTQHMGEAVVITTSAGQILESNEAARSLFGYSQQDFKTTSITDLLPSLNNEAGVQEMTQATASAARRDGSTRGAVVSCMSLRWQNKPAFAFLIQADGAAGQAPSKARNTQPDTQPKRLAGIGYHDQLTGLASRRHLLQQISSCLADGEAKKHCLLLIFDIVNFKQTNHSYGREFGVKALARFGELLTERYAADNTVVRLGGDEFALLLTGDSMDEAGAGKYAQALLADFEKPLQIDDLAWQLKLDIGMSIAPQDADTPDDLVQHAEIALYTAKAAGQNTPLLYAPGMRLSEQDSEAGQALRRALAAGSLQLNLQPILGTAADSGIAAALAQISWQREAADALDHVQIESLAQETGLLADFAAWSLRALATQYGEWRNLGLALVPIFIPLPSAVLQIPDFTRVVNSIRARYHLPEGALALCLSGIETPQEYATPAGLRTVFAAQLDARKTVSAEFIMLDSAWVAGLPDDAKAVAATKKMAAYARKHGKPVIAGPVTSDAQRSALVALDVGYLYGPLVGEAVKPRPFARQLAKQKTRPI